MPERSEPQPRTLLLEALDRGVGSAAVLHVAALESGETLGAWALGRVSSEPAGPAVRLDTAFDLASITKLFTTTAVLRLVARGELRLDEELCDLLSHRSGLPAWAALYEEPDVRAAGRLLEPGPRGRHCYSDIGFLRILDLLPAPVQEIVDAEVLVPLGLSDTSYRSVGRGEEAALSLLQTGDVAATERCQRRGLLVGEVSDGNTWAMGGASGHAGLFGPARDLAAFARGWWNAERTGYLPAELRDRAWSAPQEQGTHCLGWDSVAEQGSSAGVRLSRRSRGHLGFSGTSLWVDPERAISVVLLTNRIHPDRADTRIRQLRPAVHDAVADFVDGLR